MATAQPQEDTTGVLYGGAINYGGTACLPCLILQVDNTVTMAIQQQQSTQVVEGVCAGSGLVNLNVHAGQVWFDEAGGRDGKRCSEPFNTENPQLSSSEPNWGPVCAPFLRTLEEGGGGSNSSIYHEIVGQSSGWVFGTKLRLISIPRTRANIAAYYTQVEGSRSRDGLRELLVHHFAKGYIQSILVGLSITSKNQEGSKKLCNVPPPMRRGHMKYVAMLAFFIRGSGLMPGGNGQPTPQKRQLGEQQLVNTISGPRDSFCALEILNEDVLWVVLSYLSGSRMTGLVFTTANSWSSTWNPGPLLWFSEHVGEDLRTIVVQPVVNGAAVSGATWAEEKNAWRLSWEGEHNSDSTRQTKPRSAEIFFSEKLDTFKGKCTFPKEGSIGFAGCTSTMALRKKFKVEGKPLDTVFH